MSHGADTIALEDGQVRLSQRLVTRSGGSAKLTTKEAELLSFLHNRTGQTVARETLLEEVWGYNRNSATRTIDITVRRLRAKLERDPAVPAHVLTVHGEGYRFEPLVPALKAQANRFPVDPTTFVGREVELGKLEKWLSAGRRLITIRGRGGQGKTRLARAYASTRLDAAKLRAAIFIDLSSCKNREQLVGAFRLAFGGAPSVGGGAEAEEVEKQAVALAQQAGEVLAVVDNFEQLMEWAPFVGRLLEQAPQLRVLVTSREPLRIAGEKVLTLEPLSEEHAVHLFVSRAEDVDSLEELEPTDPRIVHVVRRVECHALAIELAAARMAELSLDELIHKLDQRFELLRHRRRDAPERHQTLRATIAWSWALLKEDEQLALMACALFVDAFGVPAGRAAVAPNEPELADELLWRLQYKSLLNARMSKQGERRLRLPTSIRAYVREHIDEGQQTWKSTLRNVATHYIERAEREVEKLNYRQSDGGHERLLGDLRNMVDVISQIRGSEPGMALQLGLLLLPFLRLSASATLMREVADQCVHLAEERAPDRLSWALLERARGLLLLKNLQGAALDLERLDTFGHTLDNAVVCGAAMLRSLLYCFSGEQELGLQGFRKLNAGTSLVSMPLLRAESLCEHGRMECRFGELDRARALLVESMDLYEQLEHSRGQAVACDVLGWLELQAGDFEKARQLLDAALRLHQHNRDVRLEAEAYNSLSYLALSQGDYAEANRCLERSLQLHVVRGLGGEAYIRGSLGLVALESGAMERAIDEFDKAYNGKLEEHGKDQRRRAAVLGCLGVALAHAGQLDRGRQALREAEQQLSEVAGGWGLEIIEIFHLLCDLLQGPAVAETQQRAVAILGKGDEFCRKSVVHASAWRMLARRMEGVSAAQSS